MSGKVHLMGNYNEYCVKTLLLLHLGRSPLWARGQDVLVASITLTVGRKHIGT